MTFLKRKNSLLILSGMFAMSSISACSNEKVSTSQLSSAPSEPSTYESTTDTILDTETTLDSTTQVPSESTWHTVETGYHENPFLDIDPSDYRNLINRFPTLCNCNLGFNNPEAIKFIRDECAKYTGQNTDITLADVGYFQHNQEVKQLFNKISYEEFFKSENRKPYEIMIIRAVLIDQNLRFGLDEIDWQYFRENFPRFTYNILKTKDCKDDFTNSLFNKDDINKYLDAKTIQDVHLPVFCDIDRIVSLISYNDIRLSYMYNSPIDSNITQVEDVSTGRNVLEPTEEQAKKMMEDIHKIPGCENIDIFRVETPEEFYASYGIYPDEFLNSIPKWDDQFTSEEANNYYKELDESGLLLTSAFYPNENSTVQTYDEYAYSADASSWADVATDPSQMGYIVDQDFELIPSERKGR